MLNTVTTISASLSSTSVNVNLRLAVNTISPRLMILDNRNSRTSRNRRKKDSWDSSGTTVGKTAIKSMIISFFSMALGRKFWAYMRNENSSTNNNEMIRSITIVLCMTTVGISWIDSITNPAQLSSTKMHTQNSYSVELTIYPISPENGKRNSQSSTWNGPAVDVVLDMRSSPNAFIISWDEFLDGVSGSCSVELEGEEGLDAAFGADNK
mmetsp:Transcript_15615/g.27412  ORF Transcript_15615/g.27412 Transcript_15615/m.27412 type:complete len:210 (+) Transcript_15615:540-1169(+)